MKTLRKLASFFMLLCLPLSIYAQQDVTKFLGIPVDGTKAAFEEKLKAKGFIVSPYSNEVLEGEFNGEDVRVVIATNNNRVWRIMVADKNTRDEKQIKIRYNTLLRQFSDNEKYTPFNNIKEIPEDEDISYELTVNKKQYEAEFMQGGELNFHKYVWFTIYEFNNEYYICMYYDNYLNRANGEDL